MMYEKEVKEKVTAILPQVVTWRRHFHEYPELSGKEVKTSAYIQDVFKNLGIPYETGFFQNAVLGIIKGSHPGKTVALRADMDALPVTELTGLPFASKNEGVMHACGHDGHMSILLGAAAVLNEMKDQIHCTVKIVFQRPPYCSQRETGRCIGNLRPSCMAGASHGPGGIKARCPHGSIRSFLCPYQREIHPCCSAS